MVAKVLVILAFASTASAVCISPTDDKHKPLDCPPNEEYCQCEPVVCHTKCSDLVDRPPCPLVAADCYLPACLCIEGYLRNGNGTCVPLDECPKPLDEHVYIY